MIKHIDSTQKMHKNKFRELTISKLRIHANRIVG